MPKKRNLRKVWVYQPPKQKKPKVLQEYKDEVKKKADLLIENVLKPLYIKLPPKNHLFNYIVDIHSKWFRNYFYFCSKYHCPGPNAISPYFEAKFARLEYIEREKFHIAFMRYTKKWVELPGKMCSLNECFDMIKEGGFFTP